MSAPCTGVCTPWTTAEQMIACPNCETIDETLAEEMAAVASDLLFELSQRRFPGSCLDTVRPCGEPQFQPRRGWGRPVGVPSTGRWMTCRGRCTCGGFSEVGLGAYPVTSIVEVKIDGEVLEPSLYQVNDFADLSRLPDPDGVRRGWPCCNSDLPDTEEGTFSVRLTYGQPPPRPGVMAARELACQLALACTDSEECELPAKVVNVVRAGVTYQMAELTSFLTDEKTGLFAVDLFLAAYGPKRPARAATVLSPDLPPEVRRAGT